MLKSNRFSLGLCAIIVILLAILGSFRVMKARENVSKVHSYEIIEQPKPAVISDFSEIWNACARKMSRRLPEPYASSLEPALNSPIGSRERCGNLLKNCLFAGSYWVSHKYKIQYMPIPKVGSTLWRTVIGALEEGLPITNVTENDYQYSYQRQPGYFTFTFVDPRIVRRFINGYAELDFKVSNLVAFELAFRNGS